MRPLLSKKDDDNDKKGSLVPKCYYHDTCGTSLPVLLAVTTLATITSSVRNALLSAVCPVYCCCCRCSATLERTSFPVDATEAADEIVDE